MAATELTVGRSGPSLIESDVKMYMKQIGSSDVRVNPVETLYASFPFFLTINATYGGWLLKPILDYASSSECWSQPYAPADIGSTYPNATGNTAIPEQGVEQTGNMIIMTTAHARATGDGSLISQYYPLLKQWAEYLVDTTWPLQAQRVTYEAGENSTNLAIKGIIAIGAMSQISEANGQQGDADRYLSIAQSYSASWTSEAITSGGNIMLTFGEPDSWGLQYNLFADKWVGTNIVDDSVYASEALLVSTLLSQSSSNGMGGVSIMKGETYQDTAWSLFTAMTMTNPTLQNELIDSVWDVFSTNVTPTIFSAVSPAFSDQRNGTAGSAKVGAMFAPLALSISNTTIMVPTSSPSPSPSVLSGSPVRPNAKLIIGITVGTIAGIFLCLFAVLYYRRRSWRRNRAHLGSQFRAVPYSYACEPGEVAGAIMEQQPEKSRDNSTLQTRMPSGGMVNAFTRALGSGSNSSASRSTGEQDHSDVNNLRQEVDDLRQVVRRILEAPPTYHSAGL
ncbi:DUF4965 and DUF1793 domain-containing protein [Phanerochaete sordida]|uniref:DUF4965 and DUF1793 domain-containing protein n=1 Tax=Phanerochaete sordida TaxID=48140 RepID=A0A9P3GI67_9APHY|nr:DUF4965 and DUF1793 domain-containing protein [Phanerochaete sordida]